MTATPLRGRSRIDGEQVVEDTHFERQHDGVDDFAPEGRVVHERRERVTDGIAGYTEDAGGLIELIEAVEVEHGARGDLAGSCGDCIGAVAGGGKGERGAGTRTQHAADKTLLAHGDANDIRC